MLSVFECILAEGGANYLSIPITSGKRALQLRNEESRDEKDSLNRSQFRDHLIHHSREISKDLIQQLRGRLRDPVVNPTQLGDVPGWSQDDYRTLWASVIKRFVNSVVFMDDWQYSHGCVYEYLIAVRSGVKTLTTDLSPLPLEMGISLVRSALTELREIGEPTSFHESVTVELENYANGKVDPK